MIKITVELFSANGRERDRLLGVGIIENVGGDLLRGDYRVWLSKMAPKDREAWKQGAISFTAGDLHDLFVTEVKHFDRVRRGCWDLIYIALRSLVGSRNPTMADVTVIPPGKSRLRMPR